MTASPKPAPHAVARPVLRGRQRIDALWFPAGWLDEAVQRRRIVEAWRAGCGVHRFADGDLLRFAQPLDLDCDTCAAWPLQRAAGTLCSAAVVPAELAGRPHADAWLAVDGTLRPLRLAEAEAIDPSTWLAIEAPFVDTLDLRRLEPAATLVAPPARDLREVLGPDVPQAASPETERLLGALRRRTDTPAARAAAALAPAQGIRLDRLLLRAAVAVAVVAMLAWAASRADGTSLLSSAMAVVALAVFLLRGRGTASSAGARRAGSPTGSRPGGKPRGDALPALRARLERRMPQRWRNWMARLAMTSGIDRLLGAQHAAYMRRVLAMFDDGRIEEALRHALPLGDEHGGSLGQAFGRLGPRADLGLRAQRGQGTSLSFGNDFEAHLRALYRSTFHKLDAQGRVDEAAFVLAELLRVRQEALDYLERHGRFAQAAELALGWDMPAAQIVRLHALAGQWRLALQVARRDGVFAEAIALLDKRWPEAAAQLRREWARQLAAQGRWLQAVETLWPLADERDRAADWLQAVEDAGGAPAARALALRAQCLPETLDTRVDRLLALRTDPALASERAALADELLRLPASPEPGGVRRLAAFFFGAVAADLAAGSPTIAGDVPRRLAQLSTDPALIADLPDASASWPAPPAEPLAARAEPLELQAPAPGLHAILDAVPLADGEFVVALGEAGAVRLDANGRRLARFTAPAHRLVVSLDGRGVLALARREQVWRVSRLELAAGRAVDLGLHAFTAFADVFDGVGWTIAREGRVQVLDTTAGLRDALWQAGDLPLPVVAIDVVDDAERWILVGEEGGRPAMQQWHYDLPSRRLRARDPIADADAGEVALSILVRGVGLVELVRRSENPRMLATRPSVSRQTPWAELPCPHQPVTVQGAQGLFASRRDVESSPSDALDEPIHVHDFQHGRLRAAWHWPAEAVVSMRATGETWLFFDDQGRLAVLDARTGAARGLQLR